MILLLFFLGFAGLTRVLLLDLGRQNFAPLIKSANRTHGVRQNRGSAILANTRAGAFRLEIIGVIGSRPRVGAPFLRYWHFLLLQTYSLNCQRNYIGG